MSSPAPGESFPYLPPPPSPNARPLAPPELVVFADELSSTSAGAYESHPSQALLYPRRQRPRWALILLAVASAGAAAFAGVAWLRGRSAPDKNEAPTVVTEAPRSLPAARTEPAAPTPSEPIAPAVPRSARESFAGPPEIAAEPSARAEPPPLLPASPTALAAKPSRKHVAASKKKSHGKRRHAAHPRRKPHKR